jgi:hypothetical protein
MRSRVFAAMTVAIAAAAAATLSAHHNASHTFDAEHPVTLSGIITALQWRNPHALVYLDAKQDDGSVVNWKVELSAGMILQRSGVAKDVFIVGDPISMVACLAKDGSHAAVARVVTVPRGLEDKPVGFCYAPK